MKFGKHLKREGKREWEAFYVNYKSLKKSLSGAVEPFRNAAATSNTIAFSTTAADLLIHQLFMTQLDAELTKVNQFYFAIEDDSVRQMDLLLEKEKESVNGPTAELLIILQHCAETVDHLRKYVVLNYIALVKIIKKHNKQIQACENLKPEAILLCQPFFHAQQLYSLSDQTEQAARRISSQLGHSDPVPLRPLCLLCHATSTNPVTLSCSHPFCWSCLCRSSPDCQICPLCSCDHILNPAAFQIAALLAPALLHLTRTSPRISSESPTVMIPLQITAIGTETPDNPLCLGLEPIIGSIHPTEEERLEAFHTLDRRPRTELYETGPHDDALLFDILPLDIDVHHQSTSEDHLPKQTNDEVQSPVSHPHQSYAMDLPGKDLKNGLIISPREHKSMGLDGDVMKFTEGHYQIKDLPTVAALPSFFESSSSMSVMVNGPLFRIEVITQPPSEIRTRTQRELRSFGFTVCITSTESRFQHDRYSVVAELYYAPGPLTGFEPYPFDSSDRIFGGPRVAKVKKNGMASFAGLTISEPSTRHHEREFTIHILLVEDDVPARVVARTFTRSIYAYSHKKVLVRRGARAINVGKSFGIVSGQEEDGTQSIYEDSIHFDPVDNHYNIAGDAYHAFAGAKDDHTVEEDVDTNQGTNWLRESGAAL